MKKVTKFGIVALLLVSLVASAFAFSGKGFGNEVAREALEAGDYATWKEAMTAGLTEDRFNQLRERHTQMAEKRVAMQETREKVQQALEAGDYNAWKEAIGDSPRGAKSTEVITEDNFETFVEMHNAMQSGDFETAKQLAEELGLKGFGKFGIGHRKGNSGPRVYLG